MNYKPDHKALMSYLYNEMEDNERAEFEQMLESKPDLKAELDSLRATSHLMKKIPNREVEPPLFLTAPPKSANNSGFYKKITTIAASIAAVLLVFNFSNFNASYQNGSLNINFGKTESIESQTVSSPSQDQEYLLETIEQILVNREDSLNKKLTDLQMLLTQQIQEVKTDQKGVDQAAVKKMIENLSKENYKQLATLILQANQDQKIYTEGLMLDFADYMEEQRVNDLQLIEYAINSLQQNSELQQQETAILLTQLLSQMTQNEN